MGTIIVYVFRVSSMKVLYIGVVGIGWYRGGRIWGTVRILVWGSKINILFIMVYTHTHPETDSHTNHP